MPVYKGSTFELQPGDFKWRRGQGWKGVRVVRGALPDVQAEIQAMQLYCNEISVKVAEDYSEASGTFDGLTDGGDDETGRGEEVWEVQYSEGEIHLLEGFVADELEDAKPGAKAFIRKWVQVFDKAEADDGDVIDTPAEFATFFSNNDQRTIADGLYHRLIAGETHVSLSRPVVAFSSTYGRQFTTKKPIPGRPKVYASTAALSAALPIPDSILFELPDGMWLERPPQVRRITGERTEISQRWEWAEFIDTVIAYPQS